MKPTPAQIEAAKAAYWEMWDQSCDNDACLLAALTAAAESSIYQHKKRGTTYEHIGEAQLQSDTPMNDCEMVTIYRSQKTGVFWVRRQSEFYDGRFEHIKPGDPQLDTVDGGPEVFPAAAEVEDDPRIEQLEDKLDVYAELLTKEKDATIERCAQVVKDQWDWLAKDELIAAIRALKDEP